MSVTGQYNYLTNRGTAALCGWEGNRRSGVAPAMRHHRLSGLSTYGLSGLEREISTSPTLLRGTTPFTLRNSLLCHHVVVWVNRELQPRNTIDEVDHWCWMVNCTVEIAENQQSRCCLAPCVGAIIINRICNSLVHIWAPLCGQLVAFFAIPAILICPHHGLLNIDFNVSCITCVRYLHV